MGFIKHALIGIALYEAVKYVLNKDGLPASPVTEGPQARSGTRQQRRSEDVDIVTSARQTDQLDRMKENAARDENRDELKAGINPDTPLTGQESVNDQDDPWKKSLANDELRAPDS